MAALTGPFLNTKAEPAQVVPNLFPGNLGLAAATKIYANSIVAKNASGYAVPASATAGLVVVGRAVNAVDNSAGAANALDVVIEQGAFDWDIASGVNALTIADIGKAVFAQDDHTVSKTDQGGTLPKAGILLNIYTPYNTSTPRAIVQMGPSLAGFDGGNGVPFFARAVITSLAAYAASGGVLTASANGAIGAQDGVTLAAGDVVVLPAYTAGAATVAAADVGPYVVTSAGSASSKFVLTRPSWWASGAGVPVAQHIAVGGEGTAFSGSDWKALCAASAVVDTTDPKLYPKVVKGSKALVAGAATVANQFVWTAAQGTATDTIATQSTQITLTAGNGTGSIALAGNTTHTLSYIVVNF